MFEPLLKSTKESDKDAAYYKNYYDNELWREKLGGDAERASARIDWTVFSDFGYAP